MDLRSVLSKKISPKVEIAQKPKDKNIKPSCIDVVSRKNNPLNVLSVKNVPGKYSPDLSNL